MICSRISFITVCISLSLSSQVFSSTVRNDITYQIFRDFAENRGVFKSGEINIPIYDNKGNLIGILDKAPMPDFSSVDRIGVATLVDPQYVVSVKHNGGYQSVIFGGSGNNPDKNNYSYKIVDRNNHDSLDFHAPRLNKIVTEVIPATVTAQGAVSNAYLDKSRYPVFYRVGSGTQYVKDKNGNLIRLSGAYNYLTGGSVGSPGSYQNGEMISTGTGSGLFNPAVHGPLASYGEAGDSGSPLFAYDTVLSKWVLVGVLTAGNGPGCCGNNWAVIPVAYLKNTMNGDNDSDVTVKASSEPVVWSFNNVSGTGTLKQGNEVFMMHGQKGNDLNNGKNLTFTGAEGSLRLDNSVAQGAGSLTFTQDFLVSTSNHSVWSGAGIIVGNDATLTWQVNGIKDDELHKIGAGTLHVNASGKNDGDLRVGDGTVILNQQADANGKKQAFSKVTLTSGRPTVVLSDASQIDANNIYFGYRGGRLDLNGNNITMERLKAADNGAQVVNHHANKASTVILTGNGINNTNPHQSFMGTFGETDSSLTNGELNVHYRPPSAGGYLSLTGGANMNGTLYVDNGNVLLSGAPVLHAGNIYLDDWTPSGFIFREIKVAEGKGLQIGQYASVFADIDARASSNLVVGYHNGSVDKENTRKCTVNDNTGVTNCTVSVLTQAGREALPYASLTGDINLTGNASLTLGKAIYTGSIAGEAASAMSMASDSRWIMPSNSTMGTLRMQDGASVSLSESAGRGNTLTILGDLEGTGHFHLYTQVAESTGDRIIVNGKAKGHFTLTVQDDGSDPFQDGKMQTLMSLSNQGQEFSQVNVALANGYADIGTYRYRLTRNAGDYMLYNPRIPWLPLEPSTSVPGNDQAHWVSRGANTAISEFTSHFNLLSQQGENTERYLSSLKPEQTGLWTSLRKSDLHYGNSSYRSYRQKLTSQSLGYDWLVTPDGGTLQLGGVLLNTISSSTFDEDISSRSSVSGINLYGKFGFYSGAWLTGFAGAHYLGYSLNDRSVAEKSGMFGYITGLGAGYTWKGDYGLTIRPETGITLYALPSWNYKLNEKMIVSEKTTNIIQYRAGLGISKDTIIASTDMSPFVQLMHKVNTAPLKSIQVNQHKLEASLYKDRTEFNIGNDIKFGEELQINVQGGYIMGGGLDASKEFGLTLKYQF